jgi:short-subunit dehydrogenase/pimeloyl-ACP methyl ester carboxylesterase
MRAERIGTVRSGDVELALLQWRSPESESEQESESDPSPVAAEQTVLLVHGYPDTHTVWGPLAEQLAAEVTSDGTPRYRVVAYDVRGAGESTAPTSRNGYLLDVLVDDLLAVLDVVAPASEDGADRPVHLVAHDWGSIQSWQAVTDERLQDRLASYTSISGPCLDHVAYWMRGALRSPGRWPALAGQLLRSWYVGVFHAPGVAPAAWRIGLAKAMPRALSVVEGVHPTPDDGSVDPWPTSTLARDGRQGIQLYRSNFIPRLLRPEKRTTRVPVQVIVPKSDRYVSPALSEGLDRWVGQLWRRPVAGGHWMPRTHPERVARWIGELVENVGPDSGAGASRARVEVTPQGRRFEGQVAVITGAGSGIGRETALALAEQGALVVAADVNLAAAQRTVALLEAMEAASVAYQVDVGDATAMADFAAWVRDEVAVADIVVNNAGIGMAGGTLATSVKDWQDILDVNVWGVIHGSRLFGAQMVARGEGGHIVNVASAAAFSPSRSFAAYATTKAAVLSLTQSLRGELAGEAVGVSAICPGFVATGIARSTRYVGLDDTEQARRRQFTDRLYRRRSLQPRRVACAIVDAIAQDKPVVLVGVEARLARAASRFTPRLARRMARIEAA